MKIAIIGCGWVGKRLAKYLTQRDYEVLATTTSPEKATYLKTVAAEVHVLDFTLEYSSHFLKNIDVAIFSMPISRSDWHQGFENLNHQFGKTILFSSTGIYPLEPKFYTEKTTDDLRPDILASENLALQKYPQTSILRFGGLMGDERALQIFFKNKEVPNPEKAVNYIHYEDISAIVELLIQSDKTSDIYNLVAPNHPSIGEILNPQEEKTVDSHDAEQRIISSELLIQEFNYTFLHPDPRFF